MRGLGVLWGYGTRDELETADADQLVDSPSDLACAVLSMVNGKEGYPPSFDWLPHELPRGAN